MHAKPHAVAMAHREVAVAVTKSLFCLLLLSLLPLSLGARAAVLPDERLDVMFHDFDGGGVQIQGPSVLVRKNFGSSLSVSGNYYVDMVSSASIDVLASASPYTEERKEKSLNAQYMVDRSTMSIGYTQSDENDYHAKTYSFGIDQSFFGDLTTIGLGVSLGQNVVGKNNNGVPDPNYKLDMQSRKYSFNASQIITKNLLASISVDSATDQCLNLNDDESCLNNPYRSVRFLDGTGSYRYQPEIYPHTHNSDALGVRAIYHLPWRGSVRAEYRTFSDSWGVEASNYELRYVHAYKSNWLFEFKYRAYTQTAADFYSDLFPYEDAQNFMARDKELSPFNSTIFGLGATYKLPLGTIPWFEKTTINFYWDRFNIRYDDFRNATVSKEDFAAGSEPLYTLNADVFRLFVSFWY